MWSLRPMPTSGRPGGVTPRASSPGRWTSSSASCSGIWKPSCGPWNSQARLPLPRTAQALEPPRISAAEAGGRLRGAQAAQEALRALEARALVLAGAAGVGREAALGGRDRRDLVGAGAAAAGG